MCIHSEDIKENNKSVSNLITVCFHNKCYTLCFNVRTWKLATVYEFIWKNLHTNKRFDSLKITLQMLPTSFWHEVITFSQAWTVGSIHQNDRFQQWLTKNNMWHILQVPPNIYNSVLATSKMTCNHKHSKMLWMMWVMWCFPK